jgi:hypothetical protein
MSVEPPVKGDGLPVTLHERTGGLLESAFPHGGVSLGG